MPDFTIEPYRWPKAVGHEGWDDWVHFAEVRNAGLAVGGEHLQDCSPEFLLGDWNDAGEARQLALVARRDGEIVAIANSGQDPATEDLAFSYIRVLVHPNHRGLGIGAALLDALEALCLAEGRTTVVAEFEVADEPGPTIAAASGAGAVPAGAPGVRLALSRGYALEQVDRTSRIALPVSAALLAEAVATAAAKAGADYRLVFWQADAPAQWHEDLARMYTLMTQDAPTGGVAMPEMPWSVDRLVDELAHRVGQGMDWSVAGAVHEPSGRLVGLTELAGLPADSGGTGYASQYWTYVDRAHRGHALGMLMKAANLLRFQVEHPGYHFVTTQNAEENRHMLDINEALGFEPFLAQAVFQKRL